MFPVERPARRSLRICLSRSSVPDVVLLKFSVCSELDVSRFLAISWLLQFLRSLLLVLWLFVTSRACDLILRVIRFSAYCVFT